MRGVQRAAVALALGISGLVVLTTAPQAALAAGPTTAPFTECPPVGADTSCGILIVINADGSVTVLGDPTQPPYDEIEDTLIGVVNNSSQIVNNLPLTGATGAPDPAFGFDNDGICDGFSPAPPACPYGSTHYEGPGTSFSSISQDANSGTVGFTGGLAPGASTYFSLEGAITASSLTIDQPITATGTNVTATEGTAFTGPVATITDLDTSATASEYSATIDWGDGTPTSAGTITGTGGNFTVSGTHTYAHAGTFTVTTVVTDVDTPTNTATATSTATVAAVVTEQPITAAGKNVAATEGTAFHGKVATVTDPDTSATASEYSATIDWGDGTAISTGTITGTGGNFTVKGTHTYADEGSYTVTTVVTDVDTSTNTATATSTATVGEGDVLTGHAVSFQPTIGQSFTGPVATFTDTYTGNVPSDFTATIDWGDGSAPTAGTVSGGGGNFTVTGTHTYTGIGFFPVTVTLRDDAPGTATATVTSSALVLCTSGSTITGSHPAGVYASGPLCIIDANVGGNVVMAPGSSLLVLRSTIGGSLSTTSNKSVTVCGGSLQGGTDMLTGTTGPVLIGDGGDDFSACAPVSIKGSLSIKNSKGPVEVGGNTILGSVSLTNAKGSGTTAETKPEIEGNTIKGNLACTGNTPAPTSDGKPNTVTGPRTGQCAGF